MNLLTVVNALNEARADADAGLLELVLEVRGNILVYGYKCGKSFTTKMITIAEFEQLRFVHDAVYDKCCRMIKEMIAHNINSKGQCMSNEKEGLAANSISPSLGSFSYKYPAIMITERNGDIEKVLEFATADDYAAYKRIEAEDKKYNKLTTVSATDGKAEEIAKIIKSAIDSAELRCRRM